MTSAVYRRPGGDGLAVYHVAHGPFPTRRRGRRPRRPFPSFTSSPAASQGLRAAEAARKGGTPGEGSPFDPLLRFISTRGVPRAAARGQGSAPGPRPLFCKKAGQKTFKRQSTSSPSPSPRRRVIQSVREADTLAAEWQLPREWERRVGPETSRGRHHPISVFLWGTTPFLWARPKKWGGIAAQRKDNRQQNGEFLQPTPQGEQRLQPERCRSTAASRPRAEISSASNISPEPRERRAALVTGPIETHSAPLTSPPAAK